MFPPSPYCKWTRASRSVTCEHRRVHHDLDRRRLAGLPTRDHTVHIWALVGQSRCAQAPPKRQRLQAGLACLGILSRPHRLWSHSLLAGPAGRRKCSCPLGLEESNNIVARLEAEERYRWMEARMHTMRAAALVLVTLSWIERLCAGWKTAPPSS